MARSRSGSRRYAVCGALLVAVLVLAGCARIPTSGPVQAGKGGNAAEGIGGKQPIQVFAQRPQEGWTPSQVVSGFLAAMASPDGGHQVARAYLTPDIRSSWPTRKEPAVTVYAQDEDFRLELGRDDTVTVTASQTATISYRREYRPSGEDARMEAVFRLQRVKGEWRIGSLPDSLILSETDAFAGYTPFDLYFFAKGSDTLVPNAIVLPSGGQDAWPADLVRALLSGPTAAVAPGVRSALPRGTELSSSPVVDDDGTVTVRLGGAASGVGAKERRRVVGQLTATLMGVEGVSRVRVQIGDDENAPAHDSSAFSSYEPARSVASGSGYFIEDGKLVSVDTSSAEVTSLKGPFGAGAFAFTHPAVSLDARRAAALSADERDLWVGALDVKDRPVKLFDGTRLSAPSWDRYGNLWVVDNTSAGARLLMFTEGRGKPVEVPAPGLGGRDVSSVRVAWDGARVAFVARGGNGGDVLTGVLDRGAEQVTLAGLHPVAPTLSDVDGVWWYDRRSLAVAGREQSDLRASYLVSVDGLSIRKTSSVRDLDGVAAASGMPLLVSDGEGEIALSQPDEFASTKVGEGSSPTYPG